MKLACAYSECERSEKIEGYGTTERGSKLDELWAVVLPPGWAVVVAHAPPPDHFDTDRRRRVLFYCEDHAAEVSEISV